MYKVMHTSLSCYGNLLYVKERLAIYYRDSLLKRSLRFSYGQHDIEWGSPTALHVTRMNVKPLANIEHSPAMIEVMNHVKVLLKPTGRSEYFLSQDDECVTAMNSIPPGEVMGRVHIADRSDKAPGAKGIEAWKYYQHHSC